MFASSEEWPASFMGTYAHQRYEARPQPPTARAQAIASTKQRLEADSTPPFFFVYYLFQDLDILILNTSDDQEQIKRRLVAANPAFYLVPSKKPLATYKVLWYRTTTYGTIKVDILLPGIMNIPRFPSSRIDCTNARQLPCAPLSLSLLLKLQAWSEHRAAPEWYYSKEQHKDHLDLEALAPLAALRSLKPKEDASLPSIFVSNAQKMVSEYLTVHPLSVTKKSWKSMGFSVPASSTRSSSSSRSSTSSVGTGGLLTPTSASSVGIGDLLTTTSTSRYHVKPLPRPRALYSFGSSRY